MKTRNQCKDEVIQRLKGDESTWEEVRNHDFEHGVGLAKTYSMEEIMDMAMELYAEQFKTVWTPISEGVPPKPKFPMLTAYFVIRDHKVFHNVMDWYMLKTCVIHGTISHYTIFSPPAPPNF